MSGNAQYAQNVQVIQIILVLSVQNSIILINVSDVHKRLMINFFKAIRT